VSFAAIKPCVASQLMLTVVRVYFVMTQSGNVWILPRVSVLGSGVDCSTRSWNVSSRVVR
jgi:hypothetical protein